MNTQQEQQQGKKQAPQATPAQQERHSGTSIPVKTLRFIAGENVDVVGKQAATSLTANPEASPGQKRWQIDYEPAKRHHKVTFWNAGGDSPAQVQYLHESWVSWEPL